MIMLRLSLCWKLAWSVNSVSSKGLFWTFPQSIYGHFLFLPVYFDCFWMLTVVFNIWLPEENVKNGRSEGRGHWPINSHNFTSASRERALQQWEEIQHWLPAPLHFCDQEQLSAVISTTRELSGCVQAAPRNHTQLSAMWLGGMITCHSAQSWNWLKINHNLQFRSSPGNCKPSTDSRIPDIYGSQILAMQLFSRWGDQFSAIFPRTPFTFAF